MKNITRFLLIALVLSLAFAKTEPKSDNNLIAQTTGAIGEVIQTITNEGFYGLVKKINEIVYNEAVVMIKNVDFKLNDFRYGMLAGGVTILTQLAFPSFLHLISLGSFMSQFSFSQSSTTLLIIMSKTMFEIFH